MMVLPLDAPLPTLKCGHCGGTHQVEQPHVGRDTAERDHLYITCGAARYFIGQRSAQAAVAGDGRLQPWPPPRPRTGR